MQTQNLAVGCARVSREGEDVGNQVHAIEDYAETNSPTLVRMPMMPKGLN